MFDFEKISTYESDLPLFHKLGLMPFKNVPCRESHYIGEVKDGESYMKIWVNGAPAQFFEFEIFDSQTGSLYNVSTGSGSLADYWPFAEKMMQNMFIVRISLKKA